MKSFFPLNLLAGMLLTSVACAHGNMDPSQHHASGMPSAAKPVSAPEQQDWGIAGQTKAVTRTIRVTMLDTMRFKPDRIEVTEGETVRLVIRNAGKMMHELVIGTKKELDAHAELMKKHPNMEHDEPWMAHVAPGKTGQMIWQFNRAGSFEFACLIAGHYQAGMVGTITVKPHPTR